jgi:hypothetical protein
MQHGCQLLRYPLANRPPGGQFFTSDGEAGHAPQ